MVTEKEAEPWGPPERRATQKQDNSCHRIPEHIKNWRTRLKAAVTVESCTETYSWCPWPQTQRTETPAFQEEVEVESPGNLYQTGLGLGPWDAAQGAPVWPCCPLRIQREVGSPLWIRGEILPILICGAPQLKATLHQSTTQAPVLTDLSGHILIYRK